jgi:hypothetical protein
MRHGPELHRRVEIDSHVVPATVLIASAEHLAALKERDELNDALAFPDSEALRALEAITRQRPDVIALERLFAATSRGAALINRIKADPTLASCEIRIVAHDSDYSRLAPRTAGQPSTASAPAAAADPAPLLDEGGTRRVLRYEIVDGIEVLIDGNPATLIDLSIVGAQVRLATVLKPHQRVRLSLPEAGRSIRISGGVAWATFEMPKEGPRYRAGVEFFDADAAAIQRFIELNRKM